MREVERTDASSSMCKSPSRRAELSRGVSLSRKWLLFRNADMALIYELPPLPAVEHKQEHDDERNPHHAGIGTGLAIAVAQEEIDQRQHHGGHVADHVIPGGTLLPDQPLAEKIDETGRRRECGHHQCRRQ